MKLFKCFKRLQYSRRRLKWVVEQHARSADRVEAVADQLSRQRHRADERADAKQLAALRRFWADA